MKSNKSPIGIFDSGFGGLTVMRAIRHVLPHENIVYFGDTARLPYGNKSAATILRYSLENTSLLLQQGIKALVIACHTACSVALEEIEKTVSIPVLGVIQPGVEQLIQATKTNHIAILGTRATIASGIHQQKIKSQCPHLEVVSIPCPLFVPLVEEGYLEHPFTEMVVKEYLHSVKQKEIDTILLACTHYPLLQAAIQKELGETISLIDPALACAQQLHAALKEKHLLNTQTQTPHYEFHVSDDPEKFRLLGKTFLNHPIEVIVKA